MPYRKAWLTLCSRGTQFARLSHLPSQSRICLAASGFGTSIHIRWHHQQAMSLGLWQQVGHQQEPSTPRVFTTWFRITKNLSWNLSPAPSSGWAHPVFREGWSSTKHCWTLSGGFGVYIACASAMDTLIFQLLWSTAHDCLGIPLLPQRSTAPRVSQRKSEWFFFNCNLPWTDRFKVNIELSNFL